MNDVLVEFLRGMAWFLGYYAVAASGLIVIRTQIKLPNEVFRKMLHIVCVLSIFLLLYAFDTWYLAALAAVIFAIAVYPALRFLGRYPGIMTLLTERKEGEMKKSLMMVFFMMAALISVFWGALGADWKGVIIATIMAWGFGDAAAALVGKAFGRRHISHRLVSEKKTIEGSTAMALVSFCAIAVALSASTAIPWYYCLLAALLISPISTWVELISGPSMDTITVPFATAVPLFLFVMLLGSFGGL